MHGRGLQEVAVARAADCGYYCQVYLRKFQEQFKRAMVPICYCSGEEGMIKSWVVAVTGRCLLGRC